MAAVVPVAAQVWDPTGNGQLSGTYYFREVLYPGSGDSYGDLSDAISVYGGITFSGNGSYSISTTGTGSSAVAQATLYDASAGQSAGFTSSGTYTVGAAGYGFINWTNSLLSVNYTIKILVSNGLVVGSSTDNSYGVNEVFIATPIASPALTSAAFNGSYSLAYFNPLGHPTSSSEPPIFAGYDALVQLSANGGGAIGTASVTGYIGTAGSKPFTTSETGVKYTFSGGAGVVTFPGGSCTSNSNPPVCGVEYLYFSPDQNFVFGGSPTNADMIFGVRTGSAPSFGGLYYQAGLDLDESQISSAGYANLDSYYGALSALSDGNIVSHQRLLDASSTPYDYTAADYYSGGGTYTDMDTDVQYIMGNGGVRIGYGLGPYLGITVAVPGPTLTPSAGVYLSPVGVVNAASSAPFTASIARGEFITLYGSNLSSKTQTASGAPFPATLNGVQVLINNVAAPLYYVSPGQVSAIVPYETDPTSGIAQIQVVNGTSRSNAVTTYVGLTAPGVFTNPAGGLGYAAALHANYSLVTPNSPAQVGETISVFVTGLGDVFPGVSDGTAGAASPLSTTSNTIGVNIDGVAGDVSFSGLAPGFVGLYQINVTIPSVPDTGDVAFDVSGPDSYTSEAAITIAGGGAVRPKTEEQIAPAKTHRLPRPRAAVRPDLAPQ